MDGQTDKRTDSCRGATLNALRRECHLTCYTLMESSTSWFVLRPSLGIKRCTPSFCPSVQSCEIMKVLNKY